MVLTLTALASADDGDDTLQFFLAKSDLVVLGEITSLGVGFSDEWGVVHYPCKFLVAEVLKGRKPTADTIEVTVVRHEFEEGDRSPELKKGGKCILFLTGAGDGEQTLWQTADFWFGVQRPSPTMTRSLKRLVQQDKAKSKR